MSKIVIFSRSDLSRDPRVFRQIEALSKDHEVIPVGYCVPLETHPGSIDLKNYFPILKGKTNLEKLKNLFCENKFPVAVRVVLNTLLNKSPFGYRVKVLVRRLFSERKMIKLLQSIECDLIIGNDLSGLSVTALAKENRKLLYDAHEYSPGQMGVSRSGVRKNAYAAAVLKEYLPKCDAMLTVCDGIADEYVKNFHITRPDVILNAPYYVSQVPQCKKNEKICLVHHGVAAPLRSLEVLIDMMGLLDERFSLGFYLIKSDYRYYQKLVSCAERNKRIRFFDPVPCPEIPSMLNHYDIGLAFFPPVTINLKHVLPNKFFEFVQGRIGVAIGPSPEMAAYVRKYDLGVVADDFSAEALARALSSLTKDDIQRFKSNAHKHAYELSAEPQMEKLRGIVESLIEK